jgi:beta-glucosidase
MGDWPAGFLWGAATSAHQTEGDNRNSDWWSFEQAGLHFVPEASGAAVDSYRRWEQDMDLLAGAGFSDYRFSIEWARIEPRRGELSATALEHYGAMVRGALARGLRPLVTLHHFTHPLWFHEAGGWLAADAVAAFCRYVEAVLPLLDGVERVCTINEPNILAILPALLAGGDTHGLPAPDVATGTVLIDAHHAVRELLRERAPHLRVGWSVACQSFEPEPGAEDVCARLAHDREGRYLEAARGDAWIGVQSYTRTRVGVDGPLPPPEGARLTLTGWEYAPRALGAAVRTAARLTGVPVLVTENGLATDDDALRRAYTAEALAALRDAMAHGVDVQGYFHWSLLDNYEWGRFAPTFGLVAVDRTTFERHPKPSLSWLGALGPQPPH